MKTLFQLKNSSIFINIAAKSSQNFEQQKNRLMASGKKREKDEETYFFQHLRTIYSENEMFSTICCVYWIVTN
jgi:hypothetical protein